MRGQWFGTLVFLAASATFAGELKVSITDQRGKPVGDAVVTVSPKKAEGLASLPKPTARRIKTINQVALTFVPYIQIFQPGDKVMFHNSDKTRHHVYSFSPVKSFEFILNPGESSSLLELDKTGVVAVGCNIHDPMISYLYVSDAQWTVRASADGTAVVSDLPAGAYTVSVWQPRLRPGQASMARPLVLASGTESKALTFALSLLPDSRRRVDHEHSGY